MRIREDVGLSFDDVLLVPGLGRLKHRKDADLSTRLSRNIPLGIPIISSNMPCVTESRMANAMFILGGLGVIHRFNSPEKQVEMLRETEFCGVAIGINEELRRVDLLYAYGARLFVLDIAHGHSINVGRFLIEFRKKYPNVELIAGNVATAKGAKFLESFGADAIKVGIGPGAACSTRNVTGFGVPQLTAIIEVVNAVSVPVIADGGINTSGDIVKALAAGASSVMFGKLLAGADESPSPGEYWGSASHKQNGHRAPEGMHGNVPRTGPVEDTIKGLCWGIRSGISYAGATNIQELQERAEFIKVAPGAAKETGVRI